MARRLAARCAVVVVASLIAVSGIAKPEKLVFSNAGASVNQPCNGGDIDINGASGSYVLTGDCGTVSINGATNTVFVEAAAKIRVTGAGNKVTWVRGAGKAKKPNIKNTGLANNIAAGALPAGANAGAGAAGAAVTTTGGGTAINVGGVGINVPAIAAGTGSGGPPVAATGDSAASSDEISVVGNNEQIARACNGRDVKVLGNENQLTLTGDCGVVSIAGNDNQVAIEAAQEIALTGNDNNVTYRRGVRVKKPRLSNLGSDNSLRQIE